jgi:hydrogenase/urease accessory protein HupE
LLNQEWHDALRAVITTCVVNVGVWFYRLQERETMSYALYVAGFVIVIGGLIYGAALMHVPTEWIVVSSVILLGLAITTGVKATRQKDSST